MKRRELLALGSAALAASLPASAQTPSAGSRPITILVPYPPGGPGDLLARAVSEGMGEHLGRTVIVDYKPGGGGQIAGAQLLQQPPDGSTMLVAEMSILCSNRFLYDKFRYDPLVDLEAVAPLPQMPIVMFVPASSPFQTLDEVIAAARSRTLSYASQGPGSVSHLLGEMLAVSTGAKFNHIPYKGSAPAMIDTMAGVVDFLFDGIGPGLQYLQANKLRAIAVTGPRRLPQIPEVKTTAEFGRPEVALTVWFGSVVKAGTAAATVEAYNHEVLAAMDQPKNRKRFGDLGFQFVSMTPQEFKAFMRSESERWGSFIKERRIRVD